MRYSSAVVLGLFGFMILVLGSAAGPCAEAIVASQSKIDVRIEAIAGSGRSAKEGLGATMHRQPTPQSLVAEEIRLGEGAKLQAALDALARARQAEQAENREGCEKALIEAEAALVQP
jgi:hypothetical protein